MADQQPGVEVKEIAFPFGGIDEYRAYAHGQPEMSQSGLPKTQSALNVRGVDPRSGRMRGGSRCGLSKYCPAPILAASDVQMLEQITSMGADPVSGSGQIIVRIANGSTNGIRYISAAGTSFWTLDDFGSTKKSCQSVWNDDGTLDTATDGNVYTLYQNTSTQKWGLEKRVITLADTPSWTATEFAVASSTFDTYNGGLAAELDGTYVYALVAGDSTDAQLWRFALSTGVSPDGAAWKTQASSQLDPINPDGIAVGPGGANKIAYRNNVLGVLGKSGSSAYIRLFSTSTGSQIARTEIAAAGASPNPLSLTVDSGGIFYATCSDGGTFYISRINSSGTLLGDSTSSGARLVVWDLYNDRLVGLDISGNVLVVNKSTMAVIATYTINSEAWFSVDVDGEGRIYVAKTSSTNVKVASASSVGVVNWTGTFENGNFYSMTVNKIDTTEGIQLLRRESRKLSIAGGALYKFDDSSVTAISGATGFRVGRLPIFAAQNGAKLFFADRNIAKYFDLLTNTFTTWTPTAGSLPMDDYGNRPELICTWRGRTVMSGVRFDAQNWFMSKSNDPLDWDYSPTPTNATQAVAGNNSDAGLIGDVITALVPYSDDLMLFGGDHTIYMMTGDPADSGQIDRVSDECGMAYGRAFCRMPNGALLFFGSRGGVYMMAPGGKPERVTKGSIDERLSDIDMSTNYVRMAWFDRLQGAFLFITPATAGDTTYNFFWDARNDSWWMDQFAEDDHNPISMMTIDGDSPDDRHLLIGCGDGYVRKIDVDATTDDGTGIASNLFIGPFGNTKLNELMISLASGSSNVTWSTHVGKDAQTAIAASAGATGTLVAGRNRSAWPRRFGHALYLKLAATGAWAAEQMMGSFFGQTGGRWRKF
jgi:hypothetical protein